MVEAAQQGGGDVAAQGRVLWLDGVRTLASTYVIVHHVWLYTWPGYPDNDGPAWLGWAAPGHLGVVVFIVVSGYSLTLAPARRGLQLKSKRDFARRRAWRILPPYWAALVIATVIVNVIVAPRVGGSVDAKSFLIHALLLQDVVANTSPNGAFWSVAVEAQIYLFFPLLLLLTRRIGAMRTAGVALILVTAGHVLAVLGPPVFHHFENLTPQLAICFVFGMAAAHGNGPVTWRGRVIPWLPLSTFLVCGLILLLWILGPRRIIEELYWVDLVVAFVAAVLFRALSSSDTVPGRVLASRPLRRLGAFSYSSYLLHGPVILLLWLFMVRGMAGTPEQVRFAALAAIGVPLSLALAYAFFIVFEAPFLTVRSFSGLRDHVRSSSLRLPHFRRSDAPPVASTESAGLASEVQT